MKLLHVCISIFILIACANAQEIVAKSNIDSLENYQQVWLSKQMELPQSFIVLQEVFVDDVAIQEAAVKAEQGVDHIDARALGKAKHRQDPVFLPPVFIPPSPPVGEFPIIIR